jgi:putative hydrolase of the HAD superfamily
LNEFKYIFFDCMETNFSEFAKYYETSKIEIGVTLEMDEEYELVRRFELLVHKSKSIGLNIKTQVVTKLYENYWRTYKSKCYISPEVREVIIQLSKRYKLAIVSNFMVKDGIEELLFSNGIGELFDFIITSISVGWRKPHSRIYEISIQSAGCNNSEIIFVGDDYENDYLTPQRMGMLVNENSQNKHKYATDKTDFVKSILEKIRAEKQF